MGHDSSTLTQPFIKWVSYVNPFIRFHQSAKKKKKKKKFSFNPIDLNYEKPIK